MLFLQIEGEGATDPICEVLRSWLLREGLPNSRKQGAQLKVRGVKTVNWVVIFSRSRSIR
jgi:hypothetical protein